MTRRLGDHSDPAAELIECPDDDGAAQAEAHGWGDETDAGDSWQEMWTW